MFTQLSINIRRRLKKSFVGSLVFAVAVFIGFADHSSDDPYTTNSIIKTAEAATTTGGGGSGSGGCAGCGGASGGCGGCCGGDTGG